jgi:hypothetical protein
MIQTFKEVRCIALREKRSIVAVVLMCNDAIRTVRFGPRGGWAFVKPS